MQFLNHITTYASEVLAISYSNNYCRHKLLKTLMITWCTNKWPLEQHWTNKRNSNGQNHNCFAIMLAKFIQPPLKSWFIQLCLFSQVHYPAQRRLFPGLCGLHQVSNLTGWTCKSNTKVESLGTLRFQPLEGKEQQINVGNLSIYKLL